MGTEKLIGNITDYLGTEEERYFSNGFKYIYFDYDNVCYQDKLLTGEITPYHKWTNKKERHLHLGTVEYIVISSMICEKILLGERFLLPAKIPSCWISGIKIKLRSSIDLIEDKKINFCGKLISTEKSLFSDDNEYVSCFEIKINNELIKMWINHPVLPNDIPFLFHPTINESNIYYDGYKMRKHLIRNVLLNETQMSCTASIQIENHYAEKSGIGTQYNGLLLTDIVLISGQLLQVLLFNLEKTDRKTANNIWLKQFEISMKKPHVELDCHAGLFLEEVKILNKGDEKWKSIHLKSELGGISADIKVVSQMN